MKKQFMETSRLPRRGAEGGMLMFTAKERALLTSTYFRLIRQTDDFFEIQSRCTKHCWIVQKLSYDRYPVRIYHKHTKGTAYYHKCCSSD